MEIQYTEMYKIQQKQVTICNIHVELKQNEFSANKEPDNQYNTYNYSVQVQVTLFLQKITILNYQIFATHLPQNLFNTLEILR
jgi:hypothetical protein